MTVTSPRLASELPDEIPVNLTAATVTAGKPRSACGCPVAIALIAALSLTPAEDVEVDWDYAQVFLPDQPTVVYIIPDDGRQWIRTLDTETMSPPVPFSFIITRRKEDQS